MPESAGWLVSENDPLNASMILSPHGAPTHGTTRGPAAGPDPGRTRKEDHLSRPDQGLSREVQLVRSVRVGSGVRPDGITIRKRLKSLVGSHQRSPCGCEKRSRGSPAVKPPARLTETDIMPSLDRNTISAP